MLEHISSEPGVFDILSRLYQSDLPVNIKHDCAARIFAQRYKAAVVSVMLYDGETDTLRNKGSYLNPAFVDINSVKFKDPWNDNMKQAFKHMLYNVRFYDFLYYKFQLLGIPDTLEEDRIKSFLEDFERDHRLYYNFGYEPTGAAQKPVKLDKEFVELCHKNSLLIASKDEMPEGYHEIDRRKPYSLYKFSLPGNEQIEIRQDSQSQSGRVYFQWREKQEYDYQNPFVPYFKIKDEIGKIYDLRVKGYLDALEEIHIEKDKHGKSLLNSRYYGLPLWSNQRCIGVIRMLFTDPKNDNKYPEWKYFGAQDEPDKWVDGARNDLRDATSILANMIDTTYAKEYVDRIPHTWDPDEATENFRDKSESVIASSSGAQEKTGKEQPASISSSVEPDSTNDKEKLRDDIYCEALRRATNSFGCVLRQPDDNMIVQITGISGKTKHPVEKWAKSKYYQFIDKYYKNQNAFVESNGTFHSELKKFFVSAQLERKTTNSPVAGMKPAFRLIAIAATLPKQRHETYSSLYYYCQQNSEVVRITDKNYIFTDEEPPNVSKIFPRHPTDLSCEVLDILRKIKHVLILDIPAHDVDGLLTLSNTENRPFRISDVQFAYGEAKRLGLEMSTVHQKKSKAIEDFVDNEYHIVRNYLDEIADQCTHLLSPVENSNIGYGGRESLNILKSAQIIRATVNILHMQLSVLSSKHKNFSKIFRLNKQILIQDILDPILMEMRTIAQVAKEIRIEKERYEDGDLGSHQIKINKLFLKLSLLNILDNELKYAQRNSSVFITIRRKGKTVEIEFKNRGLNLTKEHCEVLMLVKSEEGSELSTQERAIWDAIRRESIAFIDQNNTTVKGEKVSVGKLWGRSSGRGLPFINRYSNSTGVSFSCTPTDSSGQTTFTLHLKPPTK